MSDGPKQLAFVLKPVFENTKSCIKRVAQGQKEVSYTYFLNEYLQLTLNHRLRTNSHSFHANISVLHHSLLKAKHTFFEGNALLISVCRLESKRAPQPQQIEAHLNGSANVTSVWLDACVVIAFWCSVCSWHAASAVTRSQLCTATPLCNCQLLSIRDQLVTPTSSAFSTKTFFSFKNGCTIQ